MQNFTPSNTPSGQEFVYFFHKKIETVRIRRQVGPTGPARPTTFLVPTATTLNSTPSSNTLKRTSRHRRSHSNLIRFQPTSWSISYLIRCRLSLRCVINTRHAWRFAADEQCNRYSSQEVNCCRHVDARNYRPLSNHPVPKNQATWCLIITLANADQFSKFFHQVIRKKIFYVSITNIST